MEIKGIAIDISTKFASVSYTKDGNETISMSMSKDDEIYMISLALYKKKYVEEWYIGDHALFMKNSEQAEDGFQSAESNLVEDILSIYQKNNTVYIEGKAYKGEELLEAFLRSLYQKSCEMIGCDRAEQIVVTAEETNRTFRDFIVHIFSSLGYEKEKIHLLNHTEAFVYYTLSQKKELWVNDVTLFELNEEQFLCRNMTTKRINDKKWISVTEESLSELLTFEDIEKQNPQIKAQADKRFCNYLQEDYKRHIVSCVFFTGSGFQGDWYAETIHEVCKRRRAFKGVNLYAVGACAMLTQREETIFFSRGRTTLDIGILVHTDKKEEVRLFSRAGLNWMEAGNTEYFIVDNTTEAQFLLVSPLSLERQVLTVDFSEFPQRETKTLRMKVSLEYIAENAFDLIFEDMGFGAFFASSKKVIKKRITL